MAGGNFFQRWGLHIAAVKLFKAPGAKAAAVRRVNRAGNIAGQDNALLAFCRVDGRNC